jgi:cytosine/adenosine deaminase-related metal-dependent hydrolase
MMQLRARYIFPVAADPIEDGLLTLDGNRIIAVERYAGQAGVEDLGNAAIAPGLVNAHTHLDLSAVDAPLGQPGIGMADWIRRVLALPRDETTRAEAIHQGIGESCLAGTTTLADIASFHWPRLLHDHDRLRATVFFEIIAPTRERIDACLNGAADFAASAADGGYAAGLSPHAPYTVRLEWWPRLIQFSRENWTPLAVHLAESPEEIELLATGQGPLRTLLEERQAWGDGLVAVPSRPLDYLSMLADARRTLVVHGNYLDGDEIAFIAARSPQMSVVYCPRTHAYFGHRPYPLAAMLAAGVNVAVGTDSRASSPSLSVLAELQQVAARHEAVPRSKILQLGTINGARALGLERDLGTLAPGKQADLAVIALPERSAHDPHELLFDPAARVAARYFRGMRDAFSSSPEMPNRRASSASTSPSDTLA